MEKRRPKRIKNTTGVHVRGNLTARNVTSIINNPSTAGATTVKTKPPFRVNIPLPTRHFKGRRKTREDVRVYFTNLPAQTDDCWERIVAIVGQGGMGKTETAYKFAAECKELFPNVAWINCETEQSCLTSFLELGKHLGVVPKHMEFADADLNLVKEVYREIDGRDNGRVLLIFDNAIQLNSNGTEFGILKYLPTEDLLNRRFPYILLTTQTPYWERGINTFPIHELTEEESLDFFRSSLQVEAPECHEEFKKLHKVFDGYPLVMNLAAAQIDYIPKKDTIDHLKKQISNYIEKLAKQQDKILSQQMSRAWPTSYDKTLSNVWQLTFERIKEEEKGCDALEVLQLLSFLYVPIYSRNVVDIISSKSACPQPPRKELEFQLKECLRVLERFYAVRILADIQDDETGFMCKLGIHQMLQLVLRHQMQSSEALEKVLIYFARDYKNDKLVKFGDFINSTALEESLHRIQLSQQALPYVGILACHGISAACKIVETREPQTKAAITFWRLYNLERGMKTLNENAIQVVHELIELTKPEQQLEDRKIFGDIIIYLLAGLNHFKYSRDDGTEVSDYFDLGILGDGGVIWSICPSCKPDHHGKHRQEMREYVLTRSTAQILSKLCIREHGSNPAFTDDDIAGIWFTMFARLKCYQSKWDCWPQFWGNFWRDMYKTFHSPDAPQSRIAALRTCLWSRGLAEELIQIFRRFTEFHTYDSSPWILSLMDICTDGMGLGDERIQEVMSSFCQMATTIYSKFASDPNYKGNWKRFVVEFCSVWIKLLLTDVNQPSHELVKSLAPLKFLDWVERSPNEDNRDQPFLRRTLAYTPREYRSEYFRQFIQRFSTSDMKVIRSLVAVCRRFMEDDDLIHEDQSSDSDAEQQARYEDWSSDSDEGQRARQEDGSSDSDGGQQARQEDWSSDSDL